MSYIQYLLFVTLCLPLFVASCQQQLKDQCKQAEPCFTFMCDPDTGEFQISQCEEAKPCAICYPDSPCASGSSSDEVAQTAEDCALEISPKAYELADGFVTSNGGAGSSLYNISACSFQHLLAMDTSTDTSPIHLILFFSTKSSTDNGTRLNDVRIASALSEATKSVGGDLVLRNRVLLEPVIGANFVSYAGFPNPASLQSLLNSENSDIHDYWKSFVNTLIEDATIVSISITRLPVDVRPPKPALAKSYNTSGVDCAYQPVAGFNRSKELPWPERPGFQGTNALFLQEDDGGLVEVLNFNKVLSPDAEANATFDYISGVTKAGLRHGFLPEPTFGCLTSLKSATGCKSLQLVGSALLGYDETFVVQYPSMRAFLSMQNDENWKLEEKQDEFEWSKGVPSAPIFGDEVEVIIPQLYSSGDAGSYMGGNFATRTGFPISPTPCNNDVKLGLLNEEIANADCLEDNSAFSISSEMAEACMRLFTERNPECSVECIAEILKVKTCVDPLPNICNIADATMLSAIYAGFPATELVSNLSARCWYLETLRRGCSEKFADIESNNEGDDDDDDEGQDMNGNYNEKEKLGKKGKKEERKGGIRALSFSS